MEQGSMNVDYLELFKVGIKANAHYNFMEKTNLQISSVVEGWIQEDVS
jgi:hypothetical protein